MWDPLLGLTISLVAFFACRCPSLSFHQTLSEAQDGDLGNVEALVGANADVNFRNSYGRTALMFAVKSWKTKCRKNDSIIFVQGCTLILCNCPQPISWYPVLPLPPSSPIPRCVGDAALDTFFVVLPVFTSWKVARYPGR